MQHSNKLSPEDKILNLAGCEEHQLHFYSRCLSHLLMMRGQFPGTNKENVSFFLNIFLDTVVR